MSDSIQIPLETPKVAANIVPCHIQYTGAANTKDFFTPSKYTSKDAREGEIAYFRGLKLVGETLPLSDLGYTGYVVNKSESVVSAARDEEDVAADRTEDLTTVHTYVAEASFDSVVIYGHDTTVELADQWRLLAEWKELSEAIHG